MLTRESTGDQISSGLHRNTLFYAVVTLAATRTITPCAVRPRGLHVCITLRLLESRLSLLSTPDQSKTITVTLTDRCGGCAYGDLDFSPHAFNQLADPAVGRIYDLSWEITN